MRFRVIKAYFVKELFELVRTKIIIMPYLLPIMIVVLFGFGIRMQVTGARILIIDNDHSKISTMLTQKFQHSKYFNTRVSNESEADALREIKKANVDAIIIIPPSFEKNVLKNVKSELGIFIDASFPSRANTLETYIGGTVLNLANELNMKNSVITLNNRNLFNQALRDEEMIVPGLLGLVLFVAPAILTALIIAKEKEKGTIFNFYSSSVSKLEFLVAKLSAVFALHSLNVFILFLLVVYLFDLPFRGNFFLYWLSSEIYILVSLGLGLLISILVSTQILAVVLTLMLTILPAFLYSGILMPISSMSAEAYVIAHVYPVMYYNHIVYDVFLVGNGFESTKIIEYLLLLTLYAVGFFLLGLLLLKKELKS